MHLSLPEFYKLFPDQAACIEYIYLKKYINFKCPKCKRIRKHYYNQKLSGYQCACRLHFIYPRVGTLFEKSKLDLQKWFLAIYLIVNGKINALELQNIVHLSYPTAWGVQRKIMELMEKNIDDTEHLSQWKRNVTMNFRKTNPENLHLYLAYFQFKHEQDKAKADPFYHFLDLAIFDGK